MLNKLNEQIDKICQAAKLKDEDIEIVLKKRQILKQIKEEKLKKTKSRK